ncbi:MAG: cytochrome c [Burkholderiales bacterium]|nr:cytochrome c [Burkholderiales bacterium]
MFDGLLRFASVLALAAMAAISVESHAQNLERGRQLYENHCQTCHTAQVHGRKNRTAIGIGDLREIVDRWQANQALRWSREEIEDVVQFLANTRYFFVTRAH